MRAHDVGIGLAVAKARLLGFDIKTCRLDDDRPDLQPLVAISGRGQRFYDPGLVIEPVPYTDARVAFGIAMAWCGPWYADEEERGAYFNGRGVHVGGAQRYFDGRLLAHVLDRGGMHEIDLDPRRWSSP